MESLPPKDKQRVLALYVTLESTGRITNPTKFKRLHTGLWEMKADEVRLLGDYRPGGTFVVAHGLRKKRQVLDQGEVAYAQRVLTDHDRRAA